MSKCKFCGKEIKSAKDQYMLRDDIWAEINIPDDLKLELDKFYGAIHIDPTCYNPKEKRKLDYKIKKNLKGFICLNCVEEKLGRELTIEDIDLLIPLNQYNPVFQIRFYSEFLNAEEIEAINKYHNVFTKILKYLSKNNPIFKEMKRNLEVQNGKGN